MSSRLLIPLGTVSLPTAYFLVVMSADIERDGTYTNGHPATRISWTLVADHIPSIPTTFSYPSTPPRIIITSEPSTRLSFTSIPYPISAINLPSITSFDTLQPRREPPTEPPRQTHTQFPGSRARTRNFLRDGSSSSQGLGRYHWPRCS